MEKGPTPTKAEILATLRTERERLKMEAQHLRSRSGAFVNTRGFEMMIYVG